MTGKETIKKFIPKSLLRFYHFCLALAGAVVFGFPGLSKKMKIIGVTGTSGKSTTTDFITRILDEAGEKVASVSSIRFKVGENEWENKYKMTMPGRFVIQKLLSQAKKAGCKYVVLEITSEGIRQFRHKFINFDTAVFTNLTPEHIESHGGFENYRNEKLKLFKVAKNTHVINDDDENSKYFLNVTASKKILFRFKDAKNVDLKNGISFDFESQKFKLNLSGEFNIYNALAAICVAKEYGVSLEICKKALEKAKGISGRMEIVSLGHSAGEAESPIKVVVDYAHTPEQLEAVYKTFDDPEGTPKMICVLGSCGGGRDKWKRPVLGELAKKYCKEIIITNEDPYDENPIDIINQVAEKAGPNAKKIIDRQEAINTAVKMANPGEVVVITGKGSEPWMCLENGRKIPWDDRQIAREALKTR